MKHCAENLKIIGKALHRYHSAHGHFPMAVTKDAKGRSLYNWRVEILQEFGHSSLYDQIKKDEPWDSSHNSELLSQQSAKNKDDLILEYSCPSDYEKDPSNYVAIIGPKTAWCEDRPMQLSEFPYGGKHTVLILEMVNKGKRWGEPDSITVEELLEQLKATQGTDFFSHHWRGSHVLFADGSVWLVPKEMPIRLWQRLLDGDIKNIDDLNGELKKTDSGSAFVTFDAAKQPGFFEFENTPAGVNIYALPIWLVSVILLFRRAIKSRKPPLKEMPAASPPSI